MTYVLPVRPTRKLASLAIIIIITSRMQASGERSPALGGRGLVSQIIEPVTFARCAFIIALRNIAMQL